MAELVKEKKATALASPDAEGPLPAGWSAHQSRSNPGHFYYFNCRTGATTWNRSEVTAVPVAAAPVEVLNNGIPEVSGSILVQKAAEVVRREDIEESVNNNASSCRGVEGDHKIAQLEELLRRKREEIEVKNLDGGDPTPCLPGKGAGIGLSSGLRSRKKGECGMIRCGLRNRSMAPVKGGELLPEKQQNLAETESVACSKVKQRTKITFSEEKKVESDDYQSPSCQKPEINNKCPDVGQDDNSITDNSQQREDKESGEGDIEEGDFSSDGELYGMDEEEAAKLKSLKTKFVEEEEPDNTSLMQDSIKGGVDERELEERIDSRRSSSSDSSPERAGTRKRKAGEQLRLIEAMEQKLSNGAMEQTLREKYGYTDDTYGQRYIKKDYGEEKKRF